MTAAEDPSPAATAFLAGIPCRPGTVVLPEAEDLRVLTAARRLADDGPVHPVLVGHRARLTQAATRLGFGLEGIGVVDPSDDARLARYAERYCAGRPRTSIATARRLLRRPLYIAAMMLQSGEADAMAAGAGLPTRRVIEAGRLTVGLAPGIALPSSCFLMLVAGFRGRAVEPLLFADCAVNVRPDAEGLAAIALATATSARRLLPEPPRVALLAFSTQGSAGDPGLAHLVRARDLVRTADPGLAIDGELQADTALAAGIAARKLRAASPVAGAANVLIFPDLNAGNIAYKLVQQLAGATAIGPILQGFASPIADLSRGADAAEIAATARVALTLGQV